VEERQKIMGQKRLKRRRKNQGKEKIGSWQV
jgi:hypothetical protein